MQNAFGNVIGGPGRARRCSLRREHRADRGEARAASVAHDDRSFPARDNRSHPGQPVTFTAQRQHANRSRSGGNGQLSARTRPSLRPFRSDDGIGTSLRPLPFPLGTTCDHRSLQRPRGKRRVNQPDHCGTVVSLYSTTTTHREQFESRRSWADGHAHGICREARRAR